MTPEMFEEGFTSIPPDLAVEVVSPNDTVYDLDEKLEDYRAAGIPLVWVVYPPDPAGPRLPPGRRLVRTSAPTTN